jgi:hypothetical protein
VAQQQEQRQDPERPIGEPPGWHQLARSQDDLEGHVQILVTLGRLEPLDVGRMLYSPSGKPRLAILSIAHLSDAERMFFVSLLLNQILGWTRMQSGTTSLRAIVYMDEIFGFFPPVANPPSKMPLLTLLKQRALSESAFYWPHRTRWTSTIKGFQIRAPGLSAGCRPSATRRGASS